MTDHPAAKSGAQREKLGTLPYDLIPYQEITDAFAYLRGEDRDKETGLLHTDHILWNAAVLSHNVHWNLEDGRRPEPPRDYKEAPQDGD
jgi:hypothetical protein